MKAQKVAPVLVVSRCFILDDEGQLLLIKRSLDDHHDPGLWEVPGGKLDAGQDLETSLEREVKEETGLIVDLSAELVSADSRVNSEGPYEGTTYVVIMCIGRVAGGTLMLSDEHDDCMWVKKEEVERFEITPDVRKALGVLSSLIG